MDILVTGAKGFLGQHIVNAMSSTYNIAGIDKEIRITNYQLLNQSILYHAPSTIIHCAAIADPAICKVNKTLAYKVNVIGTSHIVNICKELNIKLIFISTDCVFSGNKIKNYESDIPDPINYYGWTKYCGENLVKTLDNYLILRLAWLYGKDSKFIKQILKNKSAIYLDDYQNRYPLLVDDLAKIISNLYGLDEKGIYHISGKASITKYSLAIIISRIFNLNMESLFLKKRNTNYNRSNINLNIDKVIDKLQPKIHSICEGLQIIKKQKEIK